MNKIKEFRTQLNLTQSQLATLIGLTQSSLAHYEKGNRVANLRISREIVNCFREQGLTVSLDDVFPPNTHERV